MKSVVWKLSMDQIRRNRKSSTAEVMVLILTSAVFFVFILAYTHFRDLYRQYCHELYGDWYAYADLPEGAEEVYMYCIGDQTARYSGQPGTVNESGVLITEEDQVRFSYLYRQGEYNGYGIGHADEELYDLCRLTVAEGTRPEEDEVLISDVLREKTGLNTGDSIELNVCGNTGTYTVSGIVHKSQALFPDIYTAVTGGHMQLFFDRRFGTEAGAHALSLSALSLPLEYTENRYGTDHYTETNDPYRKKAEGMSFDDEQLAALVCTVLVIVILYSLYAASVKRRMKEMTLLHSIGMTFGQMVSLSVIRSFFLSGIASVIGMAVAFGCVTGLDLYAQKTYGIGGTLFAAQCMQDPVKPLLVIMLFILLAVCGIFVPVVRGAQSASGSPFVSDPFIYSHKHRTVTKPLNAVRMAWRDMKHSLRNTALTVLLIGALCLLILPQSRNGMIRTSFFSGGTVHVQFDTMHFVSLDCGQPPSREFFQSGKVKEMQVFSRLADMPVQIGSEYGFLETYTSLVCLDDTSALQGTLIGSLPQNEYEILAADETFYFGQEEDGSIRQMPKKLSVGDRLVIMDEEYTVSGLLSPLETKSYIYGHADQGVFEKSLYALPASIAVLPAAYEKFAGTKMYTVRLITETEEDGLPVLNDLYRNGWKPEGSIYLSDMRIIWWDADHQMRGMNFLLPLKTLIIPVCICLFILVLVQYNRMTAEQDEYIMMRVLGMTKLFYRRRQTAEALYASAGAWILLAVQTVYMHAVSKRQWTVPSQYVLIWIVITAAYYTVMFILPKRTEGIEHLWEEA